MIRNGKERENQSALAYHEVTLSYQVWWSCGTGKYDPRMYQMRIRRGRELLMLLCKALLSPFWSTGTILINHVVFKKGEFKLE